MFPDLAQDLYPNRLSLRNQGCDSFPQVTAVAVGTTVRFTNQDPFDHHVRSQVAGPLGSVAPAKDFGFRMAGSKAGESVTADVQFDRAGVVVLGCHLHSSMRGHLYVGDSPVLAVTDAMGRAVVAGVPDGRAEVRFWHPEELLEQTPASVQVVGDSTLTTTLNFVPPRPRRRGG